MAKLNFKNKWILVTGASSGLGRAIALQLAQKESANVIISARRLDRLEELKKEIESSTSASVKIIEADLAKAEDVERVFTETIQLAPELYGVINNAGMTYYGKTDTAHMDTFKQIMDVNFHAVMVLTLRFYQWFKIRGEGAILNITSETAFLPIPYQLVYSASKHAAQAFSEGLYMENKDKNVVLSIYAPGGIATEMLQKSGLDKKHGMDSPFNMNVDKAARLALKTLKKKKFYSVPGFTNQLTVFLLRFFPRKLVAAVSEKIYQLPEEKK